MSKPPVAEDTKQLKLNYGFGPPNYSTVDITTDDKYPVLNELFLNIMNPSGDPVVTLVNPTELTPKDKLPPVSDTSWPVQLDRFYIWFPWGSNNGDLTTSALAAGISVSPAPTNTIWYTQEMSDPTLGRYWILFPKEKSVLDPEQNVGFVLTGIQTTNPAPSMTSCFIKHQVTGYEDGQTTRDVYLALAKPDITKFDASPNPVDPTVQVKLNWFAKGAETCSIIPDPGGNPYPGPGGNVTVSVHQTKTFTLTATNKVGSNDRPKTVSVNPVVLSSFTATPNYGLRVNQPVTLAWKVAHALDCTITPGVGSVGHESGSKVVTPGSLTTYTLNVTGQNPKSKAVPVFPISGGWSEPDRNILWSSFDPPVMLAFPENKNASQQMWLMAATTSQTVYSSDDGANWNPVQSLAQWPGRKQAGGAVMAGNMWLMGGLSATGTALNDVWSSTDGVTWTQATAAAQWPARSSFGCVAFENKLWVCGGFGANNGPLDDVWSSADGVTWAKAESGGWSARGALGAIAYNGNLWVLGGATTTDYTICLNEIWYSPDGVAWTQASSGDWSPRANMALAVVGSDLFLACGTITGGGSADDLWSMNAGGSWVTHLGFPQAGNPGSVSFQEALWLTGGAGQLNPSKPPLTSVYVYAPDPVPSS